MSKVHRSRGGGILHNKRVDGDEGPAHHVAEVADNAKDYNVIEPHLGFQAGKGGLRCGQLQAVGVCALDGSLFLAEF